MLLLSLYGAWRLVCFETEWSKGQAVFSSVCKRFQTDVGPMTIRSENLKTVQKGAVPSSLDLSTKPKQSGATWAPPSCLKDKRLEHGYAVSLLVAAFAKAAMLFFKQRKAHHISACHESWGLFPGFRLVSARAWLSKEVWSLSPIARILKLHPRRLQTVIPYPLQHSRACFWLY